MLKLLKYELKSNKKLLILGAVMFFIFVLMRIALTGDVFGRANGFNLIISTVFFGGLPIVGLVLYFLYATYKIMWSEFSRHEGRVAFTTPISGFVFISSKLLAVLVFAAISFVIQLVLVQNIMFTALTPSYSILSPIRLISQILEQMTGSFKHILILFISALFTKTMGANVRFKKSLAFLIFIALHIVHDLFARVLLIFIDAVTSFPLFNWTFQAGPIQLQNLTEAGMYFAYLVGIILILAMTFLSGVLIDKKLNL
ncbi:MAG: hypothetical protein COA82_12975 [Alkaliphilus sp.]|nr:hypothetical protein [bacterium AH-315-K05]MBN4074734.1 hypothetical protein [bacterium AH-315-E09]PHS29155.1 MAG: hypothetical protein COA82_12975 [Alkaliphilus sp.]